MPTVNMWCAHTLRLIKPIVTVAATMIEYPKMGLRENTGTISEMNANAGMTSTYTSGCPKIQKKCIQTTAEPPAWVSKKWPPRYRSTSNITCAAVSGLMARITMPDMTRLSQANNGIFPKLIPGQRIQRIVVRILIAVPMLPKPDTSNPNVQKSVLCPTENVLDVNGAYANHPTSGAFPAPYRPFAPTRLK